MSYKRDPRTETPIEFCELCGAPVGADDRTQGIAQGLVGRWLCPDHRHLGANLSFLDLGGTGNAPDPDMQEAPHSGIDIWEESRSS